MVRARKLGVLTAVLYAVDVQEASISMERVDGSTVKALLHSSTLQGAGVAAYAVDRRGCRFLSTSLRSSACLLRCEVTMTGYWLLCRASNSADTDRRGTRDSARWRPGAWRPDHIQPHGPQPRHRFGEGVQLRWLSWCLLSRRVDVAQDCCIAFAPR